MTFYHYQDVFKQIDGQLYRCCRQLAPFDLFKSGVEDVSIYGIADELNEVYVIGADGTQRLFKNVQQNIGFELRTGILLSDIIGLLNTSSETNESVEWLIEPVSNTALLRLIESLQYNIAIKTGMYCTEYPEEFSGPPEHLMKFEFISMQPPTRLK